jgi:hypothetical protein
VRLPASALPGLPVDVAFVLGRVDESRIETQARHGVWRHFFGALEDDELASLPELVAREVVMDSGIKARVPGLTGEVMLYQSWSRLWDFSLARTRDYQLRKASGFAERALRMLQQQGEEWLRTRPARAAAQTPAPSAQAAARLAGRTLAGFHRTATSLGQWFVAYRMDAAAEARGHGWNADLSGYVCKVPPKDRFWADPFALARQGRHYIFLEELVFARDRAHISVAEVFPDGSWSTPVPILERPYHLSYPFVFEHRGALFMIPETGDNRTVEVYRCTRFPDQWTLEKVLLQGGFYTDATLHRAHDRWWMFVNLSPEGTQGCDELNLFHAPDPLGPWTPHPQNPVSSDVRGSRPAGRLYEKGGQLMRPGQIGAPIYGYGVSFRRVDRLTTAEYAETEVQRLVPSTPGEVLGLHTVNGAGALSVVDGFLRRSRLGARDCHPQLQERGTSARAAYGH